MYKLFIISILLTLSQPVLAADKDLSSDSLNIAVVDVQQLMHKSKAAKSIQSQGKKLIDKYQKRINKLENELKESEKEVIEASKGDDKDEFLKQRDNFQNEIMSSQKELQKLNKKKDEAVAKSLNILRDEIIEIVDEMTKEDNYDLVITRADVITVSKNIDITEKVMNRLNKQLPSVKVKD